MRRAHCLTIWTAFVLLAFPALALGQATRFEVKVPSNTPADQTLYIAGGVAQLGNWRPAGLVAIRPGAGRGVVEVDRPAGGAEAVKIPRGTWGTPDKAAAASGSASRAGKRGETTEVEVAAWADTPAPAAGAGPAPGQEAVEP